MTHKELIQDADSRMAKTIGVVKQELTTLKAGRANPQILDRITVDYYGSQVPITQIGNVSAPEPGYWSSSCGKLRCLKRLRRRFCSPIWGLTP